MILLPPDRQLVAQFDAWIELAHWHLHYKVRAATGINTQADVIA